ncbi:hypothetical protein K0B03_04075 [Patescibacteria group bacterium]|nr:hypothetical protein [Patescibacteria group bacterium]
MIEIKKTNFIFSLLIILLIGLILGYIIASTKSAVIKTVYLNNNETKTNTNQNLTRKIEKNNLTANQAVDVSNSDALLWAEDATLAGILLESETFDSEGKSNGWTINYYSKSKGMSYFVTVKNGESRGGEEKTVATPLQTLKGEMIDSSKLAESFYSSYPQDSEIISLKMYYSEGAKKFRWTLFFTGGSHTINAEI